VIEMSQDLVGLIFGMCFVACVTAVIYAMADVARHKPQGGSTAVVLSSVVRPATCVPARAVTTRRRHGRHRL
jgi:hypothetical protein